MRYARVCASAYSPYSMKRKIAILIVIDRFVYGLMVMIEIFVRAFIF